MLAVGGSSNDSAWRPPRTGSSTRGWNSAAGRSSRWITRRKAAWTSRLPLVAQVLAGGELPSVGAVTGHQPLEPARESGQVTAVATPMVGERLVEGDRGDSGHRHTLPIDRVEGADAVPNRDESFRPPVELLELPPLVGRLLPTANLRQRLRRLQRLVQQGAPEVLGERHEPGFVGRRVVASVAAESDLPLVILDREDDAAAGGGRPRSPRESGSGGTHSRGRRRS